MINVDKTSTSAKDATGMNAVNDASLLRQIAEKQDTAAFDEFFSRYSNSVYSLARALTSSPAQAEEASQDAMLNVWKYAASFLSRSSNKTAQSWVLKITANSCSLLRRKLQLQRSKFVPMENAELTPQINHPGQHLEHSEILVAVRGGLSHLPEDDRNMVALYFGGGLTYDEISREISMPARTVASRIQKSLQKLKAGLLKAGFAATLPLSGALLPEAFRTGFVAPPGLREHVLSKLSSQGSPASSSLETTSRGRTLWAGVGVAVLAAVSVVAAIQAPEFRSSASPSAEATHSNSKTVESNIFRKHWDFEKGPDATLNIIAGAWKWTAAKGKAPAGMMGQDNIALQTDVLVPFNLPPNRCWKITMRGYFLKSKRDQGHIKAYQPLKKSAKTYRYYRPRNLKLKSGTHYETETYMIDDWIFRSYWNKDHTIHHGSFAHPYEAGETYHPTLMFSFCNFLVKDMDVREIIREDIPASHRDPQEFINHYNLKAVQRVRQQP